MWKRMFGHAKAVMAKRRARFGVSVFAVLCLAISSIVAGSSVASATGSPGNNGTLKIHEQGTPSGTESNDPKVCVFNVEAFNLDAGQTGYLQFTVQGGDGPTGTDTDPVAFGPADGSGYFASQYFNLDPGHYKATLYGKKLPNGLKDVKAKSKVFKVVCAATPPVVTPKNPTVTATAESCVKPGEYDGKVTGLVTNNTNDSKQSVAYTVKILDVDGNLVDQTKLKDVAYNTPTPYTFTGLTPSEYKVKVVGSDGTRASTTVTVEECTEAPPAGEVTAAMTRDCQGIHVQGKNETDASVYYAVEISEKDSSDSLFTKDGTLQPGQAFRYDVEVDALKRYVGAVATGPSKDNLTDFPVDFVTLEPVKNCTVTPPPTNTTPPVTPPVVTPPVVTPPVVTPPVTTPPVVTPPVTPPVVVPPVTRTTKPDTPNLVQTDGGRLGGGIPLGGVALIILGAFTAAYGWRSRSCVHIRRH